MLERYLQQIIPTEIREFPKINSAGDPYYFYRWDYEQKNENIILRYWFWNKEKTKKNKKRVFIQEFKALLKKSMEVGFLLRSDYEIACPKTSSDGTCGFSIIVAILEHLGVVRKIKPGKYLLVNEKKIIGFLN